MPIDAASNEDISFRKEGVAGIIELTRPAALNALTREMIDGIHKTLSAWETDDDIACVLVEAQGRAFCAGGDVVYAYRAGQEGKPAYDYFSAEYDLNDYIGRFSKPYVSFLNGIVMGGGAGISIHGSHRIATENTIFAMPESAIGFFPDVGASYFLTRLAGFFGIYLALTGNRIGWGDCQQSGLATHAVPEAHLSELRSAIVESGNPRPALEQYAVDVDYETTSEVRSIIAEAFAMETLEQCLEYLQKKAEGGDVFAQETCTALNMRSPTSLKIIWRQMKECKPLGLEDCIKVEKRISHHILDQHDFYEGVRAVLVDKDQKPLWQPENLSLVSDEMVDAYFQPLNSEQGA